MSTTDRQSRRVELFARAARVADDVNLPRLAERFRAAALDLEEGSDFLWPVQVEREAAMFEAVQGLDTTGTAAIGRRLCETVAKALAAIDADEPSKFA